MGFDGSAMSARCWRSSRETVILLESSKKGGEIKIFTQKNIKMVKTANEFFFEWLSKINSIFKLLTLKIKIYG